ncbi:complement decay-accelerating factor isoform X1 [Oncorhynchus kisutch]|uniref:Complement decay-accelerating factor n=1 Tax=Oncorhynchus kisutch TaxID=8019 RepID=A0A8C7J428_ONCKI|nr:complement decay-accelerating factor isoform X1 [Oncorhynchus kisutch]
MFYSNSWTKCLIYLIFITSGNSECPKPQVERNEHVVLTNDALLKNDFPEGSEVLFQCTNGYMKAQGSESITCTSGEWSTLELICKKKDCGAPKEMPHLTYEFDKEGTLFGASARAICDKGYQIQGSSYRQCYATGWSGRSRCEVVTCEEPIDIMNGMISEKPDKQFPEYGDVIQYSCDEGYTLIGNISIECDEDGEYSFLPECKDVNDIPLKPTTISASITTLTVPPTIQGTHHSIGEHDTNTSTNVNDIPLKSASITTSTVPPTIQVSGRHHEIGEHDINAATRNAAAKGSVIGICIVIAPTRQEKTLEEKRSYYNFKMTKLNAYPRARTAPIC